MGRIILSALLVVASSSGAMGLQAESNYSPVSRQAPAQRSMKAQLSIESGQLSQREVGDTVRLDFVRTIREERGVGVTLTEKEVWVETNAGSNHYTTSVQLRIEPYGSVSTPGWLELKQSPSGEVFGSIKVIYRGTDDNGNAVEVEHFFIT